MTIGCGEPSSGNCQDFASGALSLRLYYDGEEEEEGGNGDPINGRGDEEEEADLALRRVWEELVQRTVFRREEVSAERRRRESAPPIEVPICTRESADDAAIFNSLEFQGRYHPPSPPI